MDIKVATGSAKGWGDLILFFFFFFEML